MQLAFFVFTYQSSAKGLGEQEFRVGAICLLYISKPVTRVCKNPFFTGVSSLWHITDVSGVGLL